tara:strand:- start:9533 stop:10474 length:942 start_codon:yes stop_codon:yes gene_type:complete
MAAYTWNVTNANGNDGDMVLRQYSSFNLSSGNTLQPNNDCRGVMIFVDGDATINGTITVRGAYGGTPADNSWNMGIIKSGSTGVTFSNSITEWGRGSTDANTNLPALETIMNTKFPVFTNNGEVIFSGSNTGDGSGGTGYGGGATNEGQGTNNQGSPYSGGAGNAGDIDATDAAATRYGGQGGDGRGGAYAMGAGAGNPSGNDPAGAAGDYTGGLFFLMASGDINGSGTINCSGSNGGYAGFTSTEVLYSYGGGGAGGGRIILIARGSISSSITCNVNGGSGGGRASSKYLNSSAYNGQRGNHGTITKLSGVG